MISSSFFLASLAIEEANSIFPNHVKAKENRDSKESLRVFKEPSQTLAKGSRDFFQTFEP